MLISAGFDAHRDDPLATCRVTEAGFAGMAASLRRAADDVGAPLGVVLEGGYDLGALANSMAAVMPVLVDGVDAGARRGRAADLHPLARDAIGAVGAVLARRLAARYVLICRTYASWIVGRGRRRGRPRRRSCSSSRP